MFDDKPWFAPERFGLGTGMPIAWQGWVMLATHVTILIAALILFAGDELLQVVLTLIIGIGPLPFYAAKTRGGWKWRWGDDD